MKFYLLRFKAYYVYRIMLLGKKHFNESTFLILHLIFIRHLSFLVCFISDNNNYYKHIEDYPQFYLLPLGNGKLIRYFTKQCFLRFKNCLISRCSQPPVLTSTMPNISSAVLFFTSIVKIERESRKKLSKILW